MGKVFAERPGPAELEKLQHASFNYFMHETNADNGLVIDKTEADWPASIAATGLALAVYPVGVQRGFMPRAAAVGRKLAALRFEAGMTGRFVVNSSNRTDDAIVIFPSACRGTRRAILDST